MLAGHVIFFAPPKSRAKSPPMSSIVNTAYTIFKCTNSRGMNSLSRVTLSRKNRKVQEKTKNDVNGLQGDQ